MAVQLTSTDIIYNTIDGIINGFGNLTFLVGVGSMAVCIHAIAALAKKEPALEQYVAPLMSIPIVGQIIEYMCMLPSPVILGVALITAHLTGYVFQIFQPLFEAVICGVGLFGAISSGKYIGLIYPVVGLFMIALSNGYLPATMIPFSSLLLKFQLIIILGLSFITMLI